MNLLMSNFITGLRALCMKQCKLFGASKTLRSLQCPYTYIHHRRLSVSASRLKKGKALEDEELVDLSVNSVEHIRNFSIIAHVDHGKSTLADRLLELTGVIPENVKNAQVLDKLQVERERGITVKAQTATLFHTYKGQEYMLNLIDTPGHVDFHYEVSRSLSATQGVILLVDATQGVQAQTVANFYLAFEANLTIIPVLNKIDLKTSKTDQVIEELYTMFDIEPEEVLQISAKLGTGINKLLETVIEKIPPPVSDLEKPFKALLFDSWFDKYQGAVANIAIKDGFLKKGDEVVSAYTQKKHPVLELGFMHPLPTKTNALYAGQVGYVVANMKNTKEALIGDTLHKAKYPVEPFPGFRSPKPMVFAGVFPVDQGEYTSLKVALDRLLLNDSSIELNSDSSEVLGQGWRLGFLGILHMEVFSQRLEQEYDANVIMTSPSVPFKVKILGEKNIKAYGGDEVTILNPCKLPDPSIITEVLEPMVLGTIITPAHFSKDVTMLCHEKRGHLEEEVSIGDNRILMKFLLPLNEIVLNFFDRLKACTSGFASFDYEDSGYRQSQVTKVTFNLNDHQVEELTMLVHTSKAERAARDMCVKLRDNIPRQLFLIAVQARVMGKVVARENIKPIKKDVTAKCYGGDITRRKKLLKNQAESLKRMRKIGKINVPKETFINILKW